MYFFFTKKATNRDIIQKSILQNIISSSLYAANLTSISYQNHSDTVQSSTTFLKHDEKTLKHTFLTEPTKRNHIHRTSLNFDNLINPTWKSHRHNFNDIFLQKFNILYFNDPQFTRVKFIQHLQSRVTYTHKTIRSDHDTIFTRNSRTIIKIFRDSIIEITEKFRAAPAQNSPQRTPVCKSRVAKTETTSFSGRTDPKMQNGRYRHVRLIYFRVCRFRAACAKSRIRESDMS